MAEAKEKGVFGGQVLPESPGRAEIPLGADVYLGYPGLFSPFKPHGLAEAEDIGSRTGGSWEKKGQSWRKFKNTWAKKNYPWTQELQKHPSMESHSQE